MTKNQALSLRTQWLGERLRAARERAGFTLKDVGAYLELNFTLIGKFEQGTNPIRAPYLRDMIAFYGVSNEQERDALLKLHEDSWRRDWWDGNAEGLETGFLDYTWLEARSERICQFSPLLIPGLLQTETYAEAVMRHGRGNPNQDEVEHLVRLRMTRQSILDGTSPTALSVILGEPALRRTTGTPAVRRDQLRDLLERPDHIEIRILPDTADWNPDHAWPFTYFKMPDPYPEVAYIESFVDRTFFEDPVKVEAFRAAYDDLDRIAHPVGKSRKYIESLMKELA